MQEAAKQAIALTEGIEEPYRSLAFREVFSELLHTDLSLKKTKSESVARITSQAPLQEDRLTRMLQSSFDWSTLPIINNDAIIQNLLILKLALEEFKIDGISARDVQQVLFQKYRISKTPNAVSMSLMAAVGKYVDRIQEGKEFLYRITSRGIEKLDKSNPNQGNNEVQKND